MSGIYTSARHAPRWPNRVGVAAPLGLAGLCIFGLALTWVVAALVPATHVKDAIALHDFTTLDRPRVDGLTNSLLTLFDPLLYTIWAAAVVAIALVRGRPRVALAAAIVMALAPLSSETLKPLLAHAHARIGATHVAEASWPSGHSAAALVLALSAVLVAPARLRPAVAAAGAALSLAVGCSLLILAWHLPSDVIGGYLVASLWIALAVAGLRAGERRWPSARSRARSGRVPRGVRGRRGVRAMRAGLPQ